MADEPKTYTQEQLDEQVAGLKAKNSELLGKVKELGTALEPWKGLDPAKVKEVLTAHETTQVELQKKTGDWDAREKKLREDFKAEHDKVVGPLTEQVRTMEADLFDAIAVRDAMEAMSDPEIKANPKLILPVVRSELGVAVVDGKRVTVVRGQDGKPRYHETSGKLVSVKDRLKELRAVKEYGGGFEGNGASGSGAQPSNVPAGDAEVRKLPGARMVESAFAGGTTKAT